MAEGMASTDPPLPPQPKTDIWFIGEDSPRLVTVEDEFQEVVSKLSAWASRDLGAEWPVFGHYDRGPIAINPDLVEAVKIHEPVNF